MKKAAHFISLTLILVASAGLALAGTVDPGDSVDLTMMADSPCNTDVLVDPNAPAGVSADADCNETTGTVDVEARIDDVMEAAGAVAEARIQYLFDIGSTIGTEGNMITANLGYRMSWNGVQEVIDTGQALVELEIKVYDITDTMNPVMIKEVEVHSKGIGRDLCETPACVGQPVADAGSDDDGVPLMLTRGNSYLVQVDLDAGASTLDSSGSTAISDYFDSTTPGGLVEALTLAVDLDIAELADQVDDNTAAILALEDRVDDLETENAAQQAQIDALETDNDGQQMQIDALEDALAALAEVVANHTHSYLTGRGVGHNNTAAETSTLLGDDEPTPEPQLNGRGLGRGRSKNR